MADKVIVLRDTPRRVPADERNFHIKYAELLTPRSYEAVTHREGPLLVVAGAGSGKTRTLIYRVARLIESGVPPGAILLLTFTRRASQEMLRRAEQLVGERSRQRRGRDLPFICEHRAAPMGAPLGLQAQLHHPRSRGHGRCDQPAAQPDGTRLAERRFPKKGTLAEAISMARNKRRALDEEIQIDFPHLIEHRGDVSSSRRSTKPTSASAALLDYDDLLDQLVELLQQYGDVRAPSRTLSLHHDR